MRADYYILFNAFILLVAPHGEKRVGRFFIMKEILLTKNKVALVDDEDYTFLMQWKWYAQKDKNNYYPTRGYYDSRINNNSKIRMHNQLLMPPKGMIVDHIDRNPLNNQRNNLRIVYVEENSRNKTPKKNGTSKYLGVYLETYYNKKKTKVYRYWKATIRHNGKNIFLGNFPYNEEGEVLAAKAYDSFAKIHYANCANFNFKQ